ncbi:hypothetical protein Ahia01_001129600 [Argonauta hians]
MERTALHCPSSSLTFGSSVITAITTTAASTATVTTTCCIVKTSSTSPKNLLRASYPPVLSPGKAASLHNIDGIHHNGYPKHLLDQHYHTDHHRNYNDINTHRINNGGGCEDNDSRYQMTNPKHTNYLGNGLIIPGSAANGDQTHVKSTPHFTSSLPTSSHPPPVPATSHYDMQQLQLVHRFKELRRQQIQQQEMLMQQQQQQLLLLRCEMEQRQRMMNGQPPDCNEAGRTSDPRNLENPPRIQNSSIPTELPLSSQGGNISSAEIEYFPRNEDRSDGFSVLPEDNCVRESTLPQSYSPYRSKGSCKEQSDDLSCRAATSYGDQRKSTLSHGDTVNMPLCGSNGYKEINYHEDIPDIATITISSTDKEHHQPMSSSNLDERPISSAVGRAKTFQQLLEEELQKEHMPPPHHGSGIAPTLSSSETNPPSKRSFLRRGEGIARFNPPAAEKSAQRHAQRNSSQVSSSSVSHRVSPVMLKMKSSLNSRRPVSQPIFLRKKPKETKIDFGKMPSKPPICPPPPTVGIPRRRSKSAAAKSSQPSLSSHHTSSISLQKPHSSTISSSSTTVSVISTKIAATFPAASSTSSSAAATASVCVGSSSQPKSSSSSSLSTAVVSSSTSAQPTATAAPLPPPSSVVAEAVSKWPSRMSEQDIRDAFFSADGVAAVPANAEDVERILRTIYGGHLPITTVEGDNGDETAQCGAIHEGKNLSNSIEVETRDLAEFEFMEELAEDMSFCSDSSVVVKFMDNRLPYSNSQRTSAQSMSAPGSRKERRSPLSPKTSTMPLTLDGIVSSDKEEEKEDTLVHSNPSTDSDEDDDDEEEEEVEVETLFSSEQECSDDDDEGEGKNTGFGGVQDKIDNLFEDQSRVEVPLNMPICAPRRHQYQLLHHDHSSEVKVAFVPMTAARNEGGRMVRKIALKECDSGEGLMPEHPSQPRVDTATNTVCVGSRVGVGSAGSSDFCSSDECVTDDDATPVKKAYCCSCCGDDDCDDGSACQHQGLPTGSEHQKTFNHKEGGEGQRGKVSDNDNGNSEHCGDVDEEENDDDDYDDDDDTWNDTCDSVRKVEESLFLESLGQKQEPSAELSQNERAISSPPTSVLITKLFPAVHTQPAVKGGELSAVAVNHTQGPATGASQSSLVREKLSQLEKEIARFQKENSSLEQARKEREECVKKLKLEIAKFDIVKQEELQKLKEFKDEEMKKLRNEKRLFEKYKKAARSLPPRQDRQEIETLKAQLKEVQEEMKSKESRWGANTQRLRQRVQELEDETRQLKEEVHFMEKKRLEWMKERETFNQLKQKSTSSLSVSPSLSISTLNSSYDSQMEDETILDQVDIVRNESCKPGTIVVGSSSSNPHQHQHQTSGRQRSKQDCGQQQQQQQQRSSESVLSSSKVSRPASEALPRRPASTAATSQGMVSASSKVDFNGNQMLRNKEGKRRDEKIKEEESDKATTTVMMLNNRNRKAKKKSLKHSGIIKGVAVENIQHPDGKTEKVYRNGARELVFPNGTRKEMSADGQHVVLHFFNGDIKQITPDKTVIYYYAESETIVTTYPDGLEVLEFPTGQVEKLYPNGSQEITFPNHTKKYLLEDGTEESHCLDGTVIKVEASGIRTLTFPNGQREIHTDQFKRREYPDGTQKTIYPDGRQETKFANGHVRIKDRDGNVLLDKKL